MDGTEAGQKRTDQMSKIAKAKPVAKVLEKVSKNGMDLNVATTLARNTNILSVEVPEAMRLKIPSGVGFFDELIGDGMGQNVGTAYLLSGGAGCGKTTLMLQVCEGLMASGKVIPMINSTEEAAMQLKMTAERLGLKSGFIIGQDRMVPQALAHMDYLMSLPENKGKTPLIVGDSLQSLDDGYYGNGGTNGNTPIRICEQITSWIKKKFGMAILVGQVNKDGEFNGKNTIKHALDGHLHIYIDKAKKSETHGKRIFECDKNRWAAGGKQCVLGMDKHKGLYEIEVQESV